MSSPGRAVFLSYASQDAGAAQRIAEALRAAGVEVWFDQNELVGGDAWDTKIRGQISSCALFVPIISANTQARGEGYFRVEWRLAAQRTHAMADDETFLLPVVIDPTGDADARVPAEFKRVQWTRLPDGQTTPAFCARVSRLLQGGRDEGNVQPSAPTAPARSRSLPWKALGIGLSALVIALVGFYGLRSPRVGGAAAPKSVPALSEARKLAAQALLLLEEPNLTRETSWLADELGEKALRLDASDPEVWAVASLASLNLYTNIYDTSATRKEKARMQGERALQLDPQSIHAGLAVARYQSQFGSKGEAERMLQNLHLRAAEDPHVVFSLIEAARERDDDKAVAGLFTQLRALPRSGILAQALWFDAVRLRGRGRFAEAERLLDEVLADMGPLRGALYEKLLLVTSGWHELTDGEAIIARLPERFRQEPAFGSELAQYWLMRGSASEALDALGRVPQEYLEEFMAREPRALLAGWAHALAGHPAAAKAEWQSGLAVVEAKLKDDPRNSALLHQRVLLLGLTGQTDAAKAAWQPLGELTIGRTSIGSGNAVQILSVLGETEAAVETAERLWSRLEGGQKARFLVQLNHHPAYRSLRDLPRVRAIREEGERWLKGLKTAGAVGGSAVAGPMADKSIAVLPFTNLSDDKDSGYFADGVHEDVLTYLAGIRELRVVSRTSVMDYRGTTKKIPQIGRELNVAYVLEGSIRRAGNQVRVTGQLIRTATDQHVWAKSFDRDLTDIFAIQAELAKAIAAELNAAISPQEQKLLVMRPTENLAAYDLYLKSREIANRGATGTREELQRRERLLLSAVELDPKFLDAWCELVQAHVGLIAGSVDTTPARLAKAAAALAHARELAPDAPEVARATGAYQLFGLHEPAKAIDEFSRLVELYPNDTESLSWLAVAQMLGSRWPESLATQRRVTQMDPANLGFGSGFVMGLRFARRHEEAIAEARRLQALRPGDLSRGRTISFIRFWADGSPTAFDEAIKQAEAEEANGVRAMELRRWKALYTRDFQEFLRMDKLLPTSPSRGSFDASVVAALEAAAVYRALGDQAGMRNRLGQLPVTLRAQLELEPNNTQYLRSLAQVESLLGNHAEALRLIDRAAAVMPESKEARIGMNISALRAKILAWAGDKDQAIAEITRLVRLPSDLNVNLMKVSVDFEPLRDDPRFVALLNDPRNNAPLY